MFPPNKTKLSLFALLGSHDFGWTSHRDPGNGTRSTISIITELTPVGTVPQQEGAGQCTSELLHRTGTMLKRSWKAIWQFEVAESSDELVWDGNLGLGCFKSCQVLRWFREQAVKVKNHRSRGSEIGEGMGESVWGRKQGRGHNLPNGEYWLRTYTAVYGSASHSTSPSLVFDICKMRLRLFTLTVLWRLCDNFHWFVYSIIYLPFIWKPGITYLCRG